MHWGSPLGGHMHIDEIACMSLATLSYILQGIILADNNRYVTSGRWFSAHVDRRLTGLR